VTDEMVVPGDQIAGGIHAALQILVAAGTIIIVRHIVFTGPEQLYGNAGLLRNVGRFRRIVVHQAPAEAAAAAHHVKRYISWLKAGYLRRQITGITRDLAVAPQ